mgnify:CR=1 FL=1
MGSFLFQIASILYIVLIMIIYFGKKRLKTLENKIYISLVIVSFITLLLDVSSVYFGLFMPEKNFSNYLCKLYLVGIVGWVIDFTYYIYVISSKKSKNDSNYLKKILYYTISIFILCSLIIFILPLNIYSNSKIMYTYGPSATMSYLISAIGLIIWICCIIFNSKQIKDKKYYPVYAFVICATCAILIQKIFPEVLLVSSAASFITVLTYFTIENPDLKMIEELNLARDRADKANNAKSEFLSNMSHEIRTPLNAIVGFSEALEEENIPPSAKDEVKDIISASQSLIEIVNGILDISKIEANKIEIVNIEYDFNQVLKDLVALSKARMGDKPIEFRTNFDETIPSTLYGDQTRVKQIIINLLTNAIKYTKKGYIEFKVSCVIKDDICRLIISVEDTGIGIKKENIDKLFKKFERFDLEQNITIEGTGLGMAITKRLLDLMGGKIVVQSIYGEGSRFTVAIDQRIIKKEKIETKEEITEDKIDVSGKKVLIVDDNNLNIKVATRLLKQYNLNIDSATSGRECINKIILGENFDLILMDDMMPGKSGVETFNELKQMDNFNIPTIILTANAISGMREKYIDNDHFNDYLSKPIDRQELDRVIRKFLVK